MPTECSPRRVWFCTCRRARGCGGVRWRRDHLGCGALLLGATDRAIGLIDRFAACFADRREPELIEHEVGTLVGQRVFGMALGYEDLNDHDQLRHDPVMAVLAGKLGSAARGLRAGGRQEHAEPAGAEPAGTDALPQDRPRPGGDRALFVELFLEAHTSGRREQIVLDLDATDDPLHGQQEGRFFHGYYDCYCYLPLYIFCGRHLLAAKLRRSNIDGVGRLRSRRWRASWRSSGPLAAGCASCCAPTRALPASR